MALVALVACLLCCRCGLQFFAFFTSTRYFPAYSAVFTRKLPGIEVGAFVFTLVKLLRLQTFFSISAVCVIVNLTLFAWQIDDV